MLAALPYLNALSNAFVFDDVAVVRDNPLLRDLRQLPRLFRENYWAPIDRSNLYRPATMASYALNRALLGSEAWGFRGVNIALHGAISVSLALLARALGLHWSAAWLGALLFATQAIHTEAVSGIVGRAELLAALGAILALTLHVRREGRSAARWLAGVPLLLALFSKEIALGSLLAFAAHDLARWRAAGRPLLPSWLPLGAAAAGYLLARHAVLGSSSVHSGMLSRLDNPLVQAPLVERVWTALGVLGRLLGLTLWPGRLSADYSHAEIPLVTPPHGAWSWIGVLAISASVGLLAWALLRGRPALATALGLFLGSWFIVSNLAVLIGTIMAERLFYLPSAGLALLVAVGLGAIAPARWITLAVLVYCTASGLRIALRNRDWRDQLTLFTRTVQTSPRSLRARVNLAQELIARGDHAAAKVQLDQALRIDRNEAWVWNARSRLYGTRDIRRAEEALSTAISLQPGFAEAHYNLGAIQVWNGRFEEAIPHLKAALQHRAYYPEAWAALAEAWLGLHRPADARAPLERALAARPDWASLQLSLGRLLHLEGRPEEALAAWRRGRMLSDAPAELWLLPADLLARGGRLAEAAAELSDAARQRPREARILLPLGGLHLRLGDREAARAAFRSLLAADPDNAAAQAALAQLDPGSRP